MPKLSAETQKKITGLKDAFPNRRSAVLPALHYAQAETGHLDDDALNEIADLLELPRNQTSEVVGFYTMYNRSLPGKYKLEICRNLSCALLGARAMTAHVEKRLGVGCGETTPDGRFSLLEVECLGACGYAPMMMIGPHFYENLTREKVDAILDALREDKEPPVTPAGIYEKDGEKPSRGSKAAVPSSSEAVRDVLAVGLKGKAR